MVSVAKHPCEAHTTQRFLARFGMTRPLREVSHSIKKLPNKIMSSFLCLFFQTRKVMRASNQLSGRSTLEGNNFLLGLSLIPIVTTMGSTGIDDKHRSSVSMRGVVSSTSETNLRKHINGNSAFNSVNNNVYALAA